MRRPSGAPGVTSGYSQSEDTTRTDDAWVSLPEPLVFPPDSLSASPKPFVCSPASADTGNAQAAPPVAAQPEDVVAQPEDVVAQPEDFVTTGGKWGSSGTLGTAGGTVTWSIVGADWTDATGQNFFTGSTVALSSFLPADFLAQIQSDFDLWAGRRQHRLPASGRWRGQHGHRHHRHDPHLRWIYRWQFRPQHSRQSLLPAERRQCECGCRQRRHCSG